MPLKYTLNQFKGIAAGLGSGFCFGIMGYLVHATKDVPSSEIVHFRGLIGIVLLIPFILKKVYLLARKESYIIWMRSIAGTISIFCYFWTLQHSSVGTAKATADLAPIFLAFLGIIFLKESINFFEVVGISAAIIGVLTIHKPNTLTEKSILLVGLAGAFSASLAYLALRRAAIKHTPLLVVFSLCAVNFLTSYFLPSSKWVNPLHHLPSLVLIGLSGLTAQILMTYSYVYLKATIASIFSLTALFWGVLLECIIEKQYPSTISLLGYCLVLAGVLITQIGAVKIQHNNS